MVTEPYDGPLLDQVLYWANRDPGRIAVYDDAQTLTYGILAAQVRRYASLLHPHLKSSSEPLVAVSLTRRPEWAAAYLAVWWCGGACVPMDPTYPSSWCEHALDTAQPRCLVTDDPHFRHGAIPVVHIDNSSLTEPPEPRKRHDEQLAYVLFTSGSSGVPKGVAIPDRAVRHLTDWGRRTFDQDVLSGVLASTSMCFDLSIFEWFLPLSSGGSIVLTTALTDVPEDHPRVRLINTTPSVMTAYLQGRRPPPQTRIVNLAGEAPSAALVRKIYEFPQIKGVHNLYGPSEDTTYSTIFTIPRDVPEPIPLGDPLPETTLSLLDEQLLIAGPGLARGYLDKAGLTAQSWTPDPAGNGGRRYHTGDRVVRRDDTWLFLGRLDRQVKVRGFRIELAEVETALRAHPAVLEAAVVALDGDLIAHWSGDGVAADLRIHLVNLLPAYMTPNRWRRHDDLPRLPNGKIDYQALTLKIHDDRPSYDNPIEQTVAEIWHTLLGVWPRPTDDFLIHGGDSLKALDMSVALAKRNLFLNPAEVLGARTFKQLVARPKQTRRPQTVDQCEFRAVTPTQATMIRRHLQDPRLYHEQIAFLLEGALSVPCFQKALEFLIAQSETLRTEFRLIDGRPVRQISRKEVALRLAICEDETQWRQGLISSRNKAFDLDESPYRLELNRIGERRWGLSINFHHGLLDGWSLHILFRTLMNVYRKLLDGGQVTEPVLDDVEPELRRLHEAKPDMHYWRRRLGDLGATRAIPQASEPFDVFDEVVCEVEPEAALHLATWCRMQGVTQNTLFEAGLALALSPIQGDLDLIFNVIAICRSADGARALGTTLNTQIRRVRIHADQTPVAWLQTLQRLQIEDREHQYEPYGEIISTLGLTPPTVTFVFQGPSPRDSFEPLKVLAFHEYGYADMPLVIEWSPDQRRFRARFHMKRMGKTLVEALLERFAKLVVKLTQASRVNQLLASDIAGERLRAGPAPRPYEPIWTQFLRQVQRRPKHVALRDDTNSWTYAKLRDAALAVAAELNVYPPETPIGVALKPGAELPIALLGVLAAGCLYVPVDPSHPPARRNRILKGVAAMICEDGLCVPGARRIMAPRQPYVAPRLPPIPAEQAAYMLYTSGTTGRPKGVVISHGALVNRLTDQICAIPPGISFLNTASAGFDISIWELLGPLLEGSVLQIPKTAKDPHQLLEALRRHQIRALHLTPSMLQALLDVAEPTDLRSLTDLYCGGEQVPISLINRLRQNTQMRIHHFYGPTEASINATATTLPEQVTHMHLGEPLAGVDLTLFTPELQPSPRGAVGEICIGGIGLARGYRHKPSLTAQKFVPDPLSHNGARRYRTGDLARYDDLGQLIFAGRADRQHKIRGVRIELAEIEAVLTRKVAQAAVTYSQGPPPRLVAYVVADAFMEAQLWPYLRDHLPAAAVPHRLVFLKAMELDANGKIDRKSLPEPPPLVGDADGSGAKSEMERLIISVCADLKIRLGRNDDFFARGGDSLSAMRVVARLRRRTARALPIQALFEHPTPVKLAKVLEQASLTTETEEVRSDDEPRPLTSGMRRLWLLDQLRPNDATYNMPFVFVLQGAFQPVQVAEAMRLVMARHAMLRLRLQKQDGETNYRIQEDDRLDFIYSDLIGIKEVYAERLQRDAHQPFNPEKKPPWRVRLYRLDTKDYRLLVCLHHMISDAWSLRLIMNEWATIYRDGTAAVLPNPGLFDRYAMRLAQWRDTDQATRDLAYWGERLREAPTLALPEDPVDTRGGALFRFRIRERHSVTTCARQAQTTETTVLLASYLMLLANQSDSHDLVVGLPVANRTSLEDQYTVGFLVNTLAPRFQIDQNRDFYALIQHVHKRLREAYSHGLAPFDEVVNHLKPRRRYDRNPLFQTLFSFEEQSPGTVDVGLGLRVRDEPFNYRFAKFDLSLYLTARADDYEAVFEYDAARFDASTMQALCNRLERFLHTLLRRPTSPLWRAPRCSQEMLTTLTQWRQEPPKPLKRPLLPHAFHKAVDRNPNRPALLCRAQVMTYAELGEQVAGLAQRIRKRLGGAKEAVVGVCLPWGPERVVAMLAIHFAGAVYLPVDPDQGHERRDHLLKKSAAKLVITPNGQRQAGLPGLEPSGARDQRLIPPDLDPRQAAYVLYTSGSTGEPKGILVSHEAIANRIAWGRRDLPLKSEDRVLHKTSFTFDVSLWEIWQPLLSGSALVIIDRDKLTEPGYLAEKIARRRITVLHFVPSMLQAFCAVTDKVFETVRYLFCSGEALDPQSVQEARRRFPKAQIYNLYGPTEAAVEVTRHLCTPQDQRPFEPIGRPVANVQLHVVDTALRLQPAGAPGELMIGGVQLARGYVGRPDLTATAFIPSPFDVNPGARMYRTGDRVLWLSTGDLRFLGRRDDQIKLRGYRIELAEIRQCLQTHQDVAQAAVLLHQGPAGPSTVAYLTPADVDLEEVRRHAAERLPDYMRPQHWVRLATLPLTAGGKLDRSALAQIPLTDAEGEPPRDDVERRLAEIWTEVLGVDIHRNTHFFEAGGHSLLLMQTAARIQQAFNRRISLRLLFERPYLHEVAERIRRQTAVAQTTADDPAAVSPEQRRLWFLHQVDPIDPTYLMPIAFHLSGTLNPEILISAIHFVIGRHQPLHSAYPNVDGEPSRRLLPLEQALEIQLQPEESMMTFAALPLNMSEGPVMRVGLFGEGDSHTLICIFHHLNADGWSLDRFDEELWRAYEDLSAGQTPQMPDLPLDYAEALALTADHEEDLAWWRTHLADAPPPLVLCEQRRPATGGMTYSFKLSRELGESVVQRAEAAGVTPYSVLLSAFALLLRRFAAVDRLAIGAPVSHRPHPDLEPLIGLFAKTPVLVLDLPRGLTSQQLLQSVSRTVLDAFDHLHVSFDHLVEVLQPERETGVHPFFQVLFTMEEARSAARQVNELQVEREDLLLPIAKFDLSLNVIKDDWLCEFEYPQALFDETRIHDLAETYEALLEDLAHQPARLPDQFRWPDGLWESHRDASGPIRLFMEPSIHESIHQRAHHNPEAIALIFGERQLTYAQFDRLAGRLARTLDEQGVGPETPVAVCLSRGLHLPVALTAILYAGGYYIPLDPKHPLSRLQDLLRDAKPAVLLTDATTPEDLQHPLKINVQDLEFAKVRPKTPLDPIHPDQAAYMLYTSGSSGKPKPVLVGHEAITNRLVWMQSQFKLGEEDRVLHKTPVTFDVSVWELFWPLLHGAAMVIAEPEAHRDPLQLAELMRRHQVTHLHFVPAMLRAFLTAIAHRDFPHLRAVICSGEALPPDLAATFRDKYRAELWNLYGPTEAAVDVSKHLVNDVDTDELPIGIPVANTQLHVLDAHLNPRPLGLSGELAIGGVQLARGYAGRPALTATVFTPSPFGPGGARLYRTGDRVRRRDDGALLFLGRLDRQVKLRGLRVELGEIEMALRSLSGVTDAVALINPHDSESLVAFLVGEPPADPGSALVKHLPQALIPTLFIPCDAIPQTPNGKRDLKQLKAQVPEPSRAVQAAVASDPVEAVVHELWLTHLKVAPDKARTFFQQGGHSLLAVRLITALADTLNVTVDLAAFLSRPTVDNLTQLARADQGTEVRPIPRDASPTLSPAQERLWLLDRMQAHAAAYHLPFVLRLVGPLDQQALQTALSTLWRRHAVLRTRITSHEGESQAVIDPPEQIPLTLVDLSQIGEHQRPGQIREAALKPFDLATQHPCRWVLFHIDDQEHHLLFSLHHIAVDGWSNQLLIDQFATAYAGQIDEPDAPSYADYAAYRRRQKYEDQRSWWRERLQPPPPALELPVDRSRPPIQSFDGARHSVRLEAQDIEALTQQAHARHATRFMAVLAVFALTLHRFTQQRDFCIGIPEAGRRHPDTRNLVGFLVNLLPLRFRIAQDASWLDLLDQTRMTALDVYRHSDISFDAILQTADIPRDPARPPLCQVLFDLDETPPQPRKAEALEINPEPVLLPHAKVELTLQIVRDGLDFLAVFEYNTTLFHRSAIIQIADAFQHLLQAVTTQPEQRLGALSAYNEDWLRDCRGLAHAKTAQWLHERFFDFADRRPLAPALLMDGAKHTYDDLASQARRYAAHLQHQGLQTGDRVAFRLKRGPEAIALILGTYLAGGVIVPIDPAYPLARQQQLIKDAEPKIIITDDGASIQDWSTISVTTLDQPCNIQLKPVMTRPDQPAYIRYTSGSSGKPKGVVITHANLAHLMAQQDHAPFETGVVTPQVASLAFDAAVLEIWRALAYGGQLCIVPDVTKLPDLLRRHPMPRIFLITGIFHLLMTTDPDVFAHTEHLLTGGEALDPDHAAAFRTRYPSATLTNLYGPTEVTVYATYADIDTDIHIGSPIRGAQVYLLDPQADLAPPGALGEITIGGAGLAQGYWRKPALTAQAFIPDPFSDQVGARLYRTGDRGRHRPDGSLTYQGRIDAQLKHHGFRIEPGEIEACLKDYPHIHEAVVDVRQNQLTAWLRVTSEYRRSDVETFLREHLPAPLQPAHLMTVDTFPRTANDKLDRQALPSPVQESSNLIDTNMETLLESLWREVLAHRQFNRDTNFFDAGGASPTLIKLHAKIQERLGDFALVKLFEYPTIATFATWWSGKNQAPIPTRAAGRKAARRRR